MISIDRSSTVPVYRQIYNHFRAGILDGTIPSDEPLPSIRQLQNELGLARESIKRAMTELAEDGYIRKIQGKGTYVAPQVRSEPFWGIVVPFYAEFYNQLIVELRQVAERQGTQIIHACDYDDWERQVQVVQDFAWRRAEAIIVVPTRNEALSLPHYQRISRTQPLLLFDRSSIASQLPYVIQDYALGVRLAMEHLIEGGCRRIAYVSDPLWPEKNPIYQTMQESYSQICADLPGGYRRLFPSPYALSRQEQLHPSFDGLFCANDQIACLMTGILNERGISIPDQVQIMGYNNSDVGRFFTPQISTTCANLPGMCDSVYTIIERCKEGAQTEMLQFVALPRVIARGTSRGKRQGG